MPLITGECCLPHAVTTVTAATLTKLLHGVEDQMFYVWSVVTLL